ncbi:MAG: MBL fold metallo-hydrolase [Eubacteriales bacterium]|nr:MBL fold metallo-hydrolase [Eubacteriales bacterium]
MALKTKIIQVGLIETNCYIVYDEEIRKCIIIDPGAQADKIIRCMDELCVKPEAILLTHGHFDHILAVDDLRNKYNELKVYALDKEEALLESAELNLSQKFEVTITLNNVLYLKDNEVLNLMGHDINVIATPGHTPGGCCYYIEDNGSLYSGDTLFCESYGRTDLPYGSMTEIVKSIAERLMPLPEETVVYPGHEMSTTIGHERKYNICNVIYQREMAK